MNSPMPRAPRFGGALKRFLRSKEPRSCLPHMDWVKGGCVVLADALNLWSEGALKLGGVTRWVLDRPLLEHAFAWYATPLERWLLDGQGVQIELSMRMALSEGARNGPLSFRYIDSYRFAVGVWRSRDTSRALSEMFYRRFGPCTKHLLTS